MPDELFGRAEFFDAHDLVQVKYEMLRRVQLEGQPVSTTAAAFVFSRPSYYQAQSAIEQAGLAGLTPRKRGPKAGNKLTPEILEFLRQARQQNASLREDALSLTAGHQPTLGLDLLLRQGMAAWIQAWSARAQKSGVEAVPPSAPPSD